jgi:hypothetical protein
MKISVCLDFKIPELEISRSFTAYLELDPCNFILTKAFEGKVKQIFIFDYAWGKYASRFFRSIEYVLSYL